MSTARILLIASALVGAFANAWAASSPLECSVSQPGTAGDRTVTCVSDDQKLIPNSVRVFGIDGTTIPKLGEGSEVASAPGGRRTFAAHVSGSSTTRLVVSAALRGRLQRVLVDVKTSIAPEVLADPLSAFGGLVHPHQNTGATTVVNFDNLQDGSPVANLQPNLQFVNATALAAGISLNEFEFPPHSDPNVAGDVGGPITITFSQPIYGFGGYFTYLTPVSVKAFDAHGNQLASAGSKFSNNLALSGVTGSSPNELIQVQANSAINSVTLTGDPAGISFAADDLQLSSTPPPPSILSVSPNTGQPGRTLTSVAITGQNTHFVQGTTIATFGAGITVNSLTVNRPTSITANVTIAFSATPGAQTVTLTTGSEAASLLNGFTITAPVPGLPPLTWLGGGHTGGVGAVLAAPDGTIWSAGGDNTIKQWNAANMSMLRTSPLAAQGGVAFAGDGQQAFVATAGGGMQIVSLVDGSVGRSFAGGDRGGNYAPAISANGQTVAFGQANWGPDLLVFASGAGTERDINASVYDSEVGWVGGVGALAVSADGQYVAATLSADDQTPGTIRLYRTSDGALVRLLNHNTSGVQALAFSPDGTMLASTSTDGKINVLRLSDLLVVSSIAVSEVGNAVAGTALEFSADGTEIAEGNPYAARIYHLPDGASLGRIPGVAASVGFTPDGQWLVVGGRQDVRLWLIATLAPLPTVQTHFGSITAVAYSPRGDVVASASTDQTVKLRSAVDGSLLASLNGHTDAVNALAFSPDGDMLATASSDDTIRIWSTANFALLNTLTGHTQAVRALAFSPDGSLLASGSAAPEQTVRLWSVGGTWSNISTLTGTGGSVTALQFSPDGTLLAGASDGGIVRLWLTATGALSTTYLAPSSGPMTLAFSPDGTLLIAGWAQNILVFQGSSTAPVYTVAAHSKSGTAVAYSPDGLRVLSGNVDGTLKLWNPAGWGLVTSYNQETDGAGSGVTSVGYAPDNTRFVYGRGDATVALASTGSAAITTVKVTVATYPAGLAMTVDVTAYTAPHTFSWTRGTGHSVSVVSPQGSNGTRENFVGWSDGSGQAHTITPEQSRIYTATFATQYLLTSQIMPTGGGTVVIAPTSPDGYYTAGTAVQFTETPATGFVFGSWSGDASGTANVVSVLMTQTRSVTALFSGTALADIAVAMTSSVNQVNSGKPLAFTVTVTNLGPATSGNMTLVVNMPAQYSFVSASTSRGGCTGTVQLSCVLGTITAAGVVTGTINVTPNTAGSVSLTASVNGGTGDPNPANNSATVAVAVLPAGLPPILWMGGNPFLNESSDPLQAILPTSDGLIWLPGPDELVQYRASDLRLLHTLAPDIYSYGGFTVTPDGKYSAYGTGNNAFVYRSNGSLAANFSGGGSSYSLSADGQWLAFRDTSFIHIASLATGSQITRYEGILVVALSPDGTLLAVVDPPSIELYNTADFSLSRALSGLTDGATVMSFSQDGSLLMAASDNQLIIWRLADLLVVQNLTYPSGSYTFAFSADGQFVARGNGSNAQVSRVSDGSVVASFPAGCSVGMAFALDGQSLLCKSGGLTSYGLPQGVQRPYLTGPHTSVTALAYSPAGNEIATAGGEPDIFVWDTAAGTALIPIPANCCNGNDGGVAFSPDGTKLAAGVLYNNVTVWNTSGYGVLATLTGHTQPVKAVAFSPDNTLLATASTSPEQVVKLWSTQTWTLVRTLTGASNGLRSVQFSPDGTTVVAGGDDGIAREWNVSTGKVVHSYLATGQGSMRIQYSPDGTRLAAGWTSKVLIFNEGTSSPVQTLLAHTQNNTTVAWSPDGKRLISGNPDGTVDVWDTTTWGQLSQYNSETYAQNGGVLSVAYSPDNSQFAYGRADSVVVAVDSGNAPSGIVTTVTTNPPGLNMVVDGATIASPQTFRWLAGTTHTVGNPSPQQGGAGIRDVFSYWSDGGAQNHTITTPSTSSTFTAQFNQQYLLTPAVSPGASGSILVTPTSADGYYDFGTAVQAVATANIGYVFGTWTGAASGTTNPASVTMSGPQTLTANFSALPTTILTTSPPGLFLTVDGAPYTSPQAFNWSAGGSHTVAASPTQGTRALRYAFANWGDGGAMSHAITAPAVSTTVSANYTTQYPLATTSNPPAGGTITANPTASEGYYNVGSAVQLTAAAAAGYTFSSWSGDVSGAANQQSLTMNAAHSVTANFTVATYSSCDLNQSGSVTVSDVQTMINEAFGVAKATHDLNHDSVVNVIDIQLVVNAALGMVCPAI